MIHLGKQLFEDAVQRPRIFGPCKVMLRYKSKISEKDEKLNVHVYFKKFKLRKGITQKISFLYHSRWTQFLTVDFDIFQISVRKSVVE